jgi:chemotaxis protein methyltransferase CheR
MESLLFDAKLTDAQFDRIARLVYDMAGIHLPRGKETLVHARLSRRLRALGLQDFKQYLALLDSVEGAQEIPNLIDAVTTNKTSFFREPDHFDFLRDALLRRVQKAGAHLRLWSAGCSSGEEPYSLAITLYDALPDPSACDVKILATDVSHRVLEVARAAEYPAEALSDVPKEVVARHFEPVGCPSSALCLYRVRPHIRQWVRIAHLNLMGPWPMQGPFDAILCRNVMIYFDKPTQRRLIDRFCSLLRPGGWLLVGHSESLNGVDRRLRYVQPAVYEVLP